MKRVGGGKTESAQRSELIGAARAHSSTSCTSFTRRAGRASPTSTSKRPTDGPRLNLTGEEGELLLRHRGEALKALQHVVDMAFGRELDRTNASCSSTASATAKARTSSCEQMAHTCWQRAKDTGIDQQLGPLNPYERRLVHMAVAEVPACRPKASATPFRRP